MKFGEEPVIARTLFIEHFAVEGDPEADDPDAVYDLNAMSWRDFELSKTITLKDAEAWAKQSLEVSRKSMVKTTDPQVKRFAAATLEPEFTVTRDGDVLVLRNEIITYRFAGALQLDRVQRRRLLDYDRLMAYRKGMVLRQQHPATQLAVDEELARLDHFPSRCDVEIRPTDEIVKIQITMRIDDLTESELAWARTALKRR